MVDFKSRNYNLSLYTLKDFSLILRMQCTLQDVKWFYLDKLTEQTHYNRNKVAISTTASFPDYSNTEFLIFWSFHVQYI